MRSRRWQGLIAGLALAAAVAVAVSGQGVSNTPLPTAPEAGSAPGLEGLTRNGTETVDGKKWARYDQAPARLKAGSYELVHDGVTRHGQGIAETPPVTWDPPDGDYPNEDWWVEGVPYILHLIHCPGVPDPCVNKYRGGFDLFSWRGDFSNPFAGTVALNKWDIWVALVTHPAGGTLTVNRAGPLKFSGAGEGNYTCQGLTQEVVIAADYNNIIRTNLVVRPGFKYWNSTTASFRPNPYGQTRRMTHSFGLHGDGTTDATVVEAYTNEFSEFVGIPANSGNGGYCAQEVLQEP